MMDSKFLIFVLFGTLVSPYSFDGHPEKVHSKTRTMVLAIDRILDDAITGRSNLLFICAKTKSQSHDVLHPNVLLDDLLQFMSNETKLTVVLDADDYKRQIGHNYSLLIVDGIESFSEIYGFMTKPVNQTFTKFESNGYFVIVLTSSEENHYETVNSIFLDCWRYGVTNVVILVPTQSYSRILLYTYFPYSDEHCEQVKPMVRNYFENNSFGLDLPHFPTKCGNFHQCSLHVAATDDPPYTFLTDDGIDKTFYFGGLDAMVVGEISRRLNFEVIVLPYDGDFYYLDTYFKVNISVAGPRPFRGYRQQRQATIPYAYDTKLFVIPRGKKYSSLAKLFFPFKPDVWIGVCSTFLAMVTIIFILKLFSKEKCDFMIGRNNDVPLLNLLSIILGGTVTIHQVPRRNFARTIMAILLLTTLILRNAYLGNLFNFLRTEKRMEPLYYKQNIYDSDVKIYHNSRGVVFDSPELEKRKITGRLTYDEMRDDNLDVVCVALKNKIDYNNFVNYREPTILMTRDYLNLHTIELFVRKHSCLKISIDRQISALRSSGLVEHWQKSYTKTVKDIENKEPKALKIDQFIGIIVICAAMYALSLLIFAMEWFTSKVERIKTIMDFVTLK